MRVPQLLFPLVLIGLFTSAHPSSAAPVPVPGIVWVRQIVVLTNRIRGENGLPPVKLQESLARAAQWQAQDMADQNTITHSDHMGREYDSRISANGYEDYRSVGENVAAGQSTPEEVVDAWMQSPGHRANILNPDYNEMGVGYFYRKESEYKHFWVEDFGRRDGVYPVIVNAGEPQTAVPLVSLYIHGDDTIREMRFSNDGRNWTRWEPYQPRRDWQLEAGTGPHTVYAELRGSNKHYHSDDTIEVVDRPLIPAIPVKRPPARTGV